MSRLSARGDPLQRFLRQFIESRHTHLQMFFLCIFDLVWLMPCKLCTNKVPRYNLQNALSIHLPILRIDNGLTLAAFTVQMLSRT